MIDEPYRWLEAVANRREYIQDQLKGGSPIILLAYENGILLATIGRDHQKIFEVYDRIAFSAIGHPADIERLRMVAIDLAHVEGFTRATQDVSLRRLVNFGVSPTVKTAFEQIFNAPYIARIMFAELGESADEDLICKIDYDGSFRLTSGGEHRCLFDVIAGSAQLETAISDWLRQKIDGPLRTRDDALEIALEAWIVGKHLGFEGEESKAKLPDNFDAKKALREEVKSGTIEAAILDRSRPEDNKFARLTEKEFRDVLK